LGRLGKTAQLSHFHKNLHGSQMIQSLPPTSIIIH
jgi:hypothetical protein